MRPCNALIQYFLFILLSLFIYNCVGHEHHNHVDPVTTKYSQSAVTIDPLKTTNVQNNNDDDHVHDTLDARLRAKHDLRKSLHQQSDDDKHESEEDYINRLNEPLENEYKTDHQFQYAVPPTADLVNNTSTQTLQVPVQIQNETASLPPLSIDQQQHSRDVPSSTEAPPITDKLKDVQNLDNKINGKVILEEVIPPVQVRIDEKQPTDPVQKNVVKEDILFIHKETISSTQSHQQEPIHNVVKPINDQILASPDPQQPISDAVINHTVQDNSSLDVKPSSPTPLQTDPQQVSDSIQNVRSLDPKPDEQQKLSDAIQPDRALNLQSDQQISDSIQNTSSLDQNSTPPTPIKLDPIPKTTQNVNSLDQQQQKIPETIQNNNAAVQVDPLPQVVDTIKSPETITNDTKQDDSLSVQKESPTVVQKTLPPTRILRSATSKMHQKAQLRHRQVQSDEEPITNEQEAEHISPEKITAEPIQRHKEPENILTETTSPEPIRNHQEAENISIEKTTPQLIKSHQEPENISIETATVEPKNISTDNTITKPILPLTIMPTVDQSIKEHNQSSSSSFKPEVPHVETGQQSIEDLDPDNETEIEIDDQNLKPLDIIDLPRQVHVHDSNIILNELKEDLNKNTNLSLNEEIESNTTVASFLVNDHSPHLPRILENEDETVTTTYQTIENLNQTESKAEEANNSLPINPILNISDNALPIKHRQVCWRLPKPFGSSFELIENQILRFIHLLPEFLQTILFGRVDDREILMNTMWFGSICTICFFFSFIFLTMGAKRLKQSKHEKEIRARCQQLQQYNNQIELERATFERQNQKLSDEIDELKNLPVRDADEDLFELREKYDRIQADFKIIRSERDALHQDMDYKQNVMQKHEFDMQKQVETVAYLNDEILRQKQELEKERGTIARLQSNDLSLERFEKLQAIIHELKSEISQLKQEKFSQTDQLQDIQERSNQLDIENNQLTIKMKQLKDLLEQRDETITRIREKMINNDNENNTTEMGDLLSTVTENESNNDQQLYLTIDNDVAKANQHMRNLHSEIEEKTRRIKDLDSLLNQEKDRCKEIETKLKVVLELRERDAHLHIRQLGQSDAELRKARTDTERVRILQQQLELKQQQLDDVQKVLATEQTKSSEESSKLQHETHEKWMEVKRITRELDGARKECEGLRRQITKYANSERSSQEKTMLKPVPQHMNNSSRVLSEPETNGSSPPPPQHYQQGDNFRPIDHQRNDSGAASPAEMFRTRPPHFGLARPPFFPPPFMPPPHHNPFMMGPRFPMPVGGPHGMISPIAHLMTNGSGGGSDTNSFEIVDSANITPNSTSYDVQFNGSAVSPSANDEQQATAKAKKPKKSLKKKTKTPTTTTTAAAASVTKKDV